jgi:arylsulfatase A-like enzyme
MRAYTPATLIAALALTAAAIAQADPPDRPNILFFLVDDMGATDTSEPFVFDDAGRPQEAPLNDRYRTPHLEDLAGRGMKFTQAYACSVCTPTRVSLMTGMNAARHRVTTWTHPDLPQDTGSNQEPHLRSPAWRQAGIDETDVTLPRLLREAGYRTIHAGKAHFGPNGTFGGDPRDLGFDLNIAGHGAGGPGSYLATHDFSAAWRGGGHMWDVPGLEHYHGQDVFLTEALTREMGAAIGQAVADGRPFFAYMAHYAVHAPFEVDARFAAHYPDLEGHDLAFATMVEGMDRSLGDLLRRLDEFGVAEETLIVFFSDNGSDGPPNLPLRGKKGMRHEGGIRVPLVIGWAKPAPDHPLQRRLPIRPGSVEDDLVVCEDLFPTVAAVAGVTLGHRVDGQDLSPYLRGIPGTHRPQQWLMHFPHGHNHDHFTVYRQGPWKLIHSYGPKAWELYQLSADLGERRDLVESRPELARALAGEMVKALESHGAQLPVDAETGAPVGPDVAALDALVGAAAVTASAPLPADDLDLGALIRPIRDDNLFRDADWFTWCHSIVRGDDGGYHLFYVRWPRRFGFHAWLTHSEIARAVADAPAGPYAHVETVIPARGDHGWNQLNAHNVKVERFGERWFLYHIGTNDGGLGLSEADLIAIAARGYPHPQWRVLRNNQRTGVAVAESLGGPWRTLPDPVAEPGGPVSTVTVNPDVWQRGDGRYQMIFKGDHPGVGLAHAQAIADRPEGPFVALPDTVFHARRSEDCSTWWDPRRGLRYGLLHDLRGFTMIVSADDLHWRPARHARVIGERIERADGAALEPQRYERPFVFTEDGRPRVLGGAVKTGDDAFIVLIPLDG